MRTIGGEGGKRQIKIYLYFNKSLRNSSIKYLTYNSGFDCDNAPVKILLPPMSWHKLAKSNVSKLFQDLSLNQFPIGVAHKYVLFEYHLFFMIKECMSDCGCGVAQKLSARFMIKRLAVQIPLWNRSFSSFLCFVISSETGSSWRCKWP